MKRVVVLTLILAMAGFAYADRLVDPSAYSLTYEPIGSGSGPRDPIGWSNIDQTGNISGIQGTNTIVGYEDYQSSTAVWGSGPTFTLTTFKFIGGVSAPNQVVFFNFYDSATTPDGLSYYLYIGAQFPNAGNYIWTLNLSTPQTVDTNGFIEFDANDYGYGVPTLTIFEDDSGPSVGTSAAAPNDPYTCSFEFQGTPEPASVLLLGLAGLLIRRR